MSNSTDSPPVSASIASLRSVSRVFPARRRTPPRTALEAVSLDVGSREWVALLGPNGSGKSTLLHILGAADAPTAGEARVIGLDAGSRAPEVRRQVGVVFQNPGLDALLTVRENLGMQASLHGIRGARAAERIRAAADTFELTDRLDDRVGALSGGLKRRTDLARALLPQPRLLLVDEPTAGLDHSSRAAFLDVLDGLRASSDLAIVMSTHLMDEAARADRVVMLSKGRIVADETPERLCASRGAAKLRTGRAGADALSAVGWAPTASGGWWMLLGDSASLHRASGVLLRASIPFEFTLPTLGDVYRSLTGESLEHGTEAPA